MFQQENSLPPSKHVPVTALLAKHKAASASVPQHLEKCSGSFCEERCSYPAGAPDHTP